MRRIQPWIVMVAALFVAYQRIWHAGFIWDDDQHLTQNPCIVGPLGFGAIWTTAAATYYPLVLTNFWLQHALWGLNPLPYHLVNIAVHAACGILLWRVLLRLEVRGAWLGAAIWALHPVQVESVAWITELKNTQSCFFYLLAILFFLKWLETRTMQDRQEATRDYLAALCCGLLAILSKSSTVMLPVVLGLCWWWKDDSWRWANVKRLFPFLLVSVVASLWTIWEQKFHAGAVGAEWAQTWPERLIIAGRDFWFYLGKLIWPYPLTFIYPRWNVNAGQWFAYVPLFTAVVVMLSLWLRRAGKARPIFFAAAYFVVSLFPVLDFFDVYFFGFSFVSDHFQYLASMGPLVLAGAGISFALEFFDTKRRSVLEPLVSFVVLFGLGLLTWAQSAIYTDVETLWRDTIAHNPNSSLVRNNFGNALLERGKNAEAIAQYRKVLEMLPADRYVHDNLANALLRDGQLDEAVAEYGKAVEKRPDDPDAAYSLGVALARQGSFDEAISFFRKSLAQRSEPAFVSSLPFRQRAMENRRSASIHRDLANALLQKGDIDGAVSEYEQGLAKSNDPDLQNDLGNALLEKGTIDQAITHYLQAAQLRPDDPDVQNNLGSALVRQGEADQAIAHFQKAIELRGDRDSSARAGTHYNLANVLLQKGEINQAIVHYREAIALRSDYAEAHGNLGIALQRHGKFGEALAEYEETLRIAPQSLPTLNNLARLLATCPDLSLRQGSRAVELAKQAVELSHNQDPLVFRTLSAADAESGQFSDAVAAAEQALQLAAGQANDSWMESVRREMESYRAHQRPSGFK